MAIDVKLAQAAQAYGQALNRAVDGGGEGGEAEQPKGPSFASLLGDAAQQAVGATRESEGLALQSLGKSVELTDIVAAVTNAEVTLETVVAVRDRVIAAYQDIIKMPI